MDVTTVTGLTLTNAASTSILFKDGATTTATVGGYFNITVSGITINANIIGGTSSNTNSTASVLNMGLNAPSTAFIVGDCTGSATVNGANYAVNFSGTGTLTITGNLVGGSGGSGRNAVITGGIGVTPVSGSGGVLNINGNVSGGTGTDNCFGLVVGGNFVTVNIIGNITAGVNGGANAGIRIQGAENTINITATTISCPPSTAAISAIDSNTNLANTLNIVADTITGGRVNGQSTISTGEYITTIIQAENILGGTFTNSVNTYAVGIGGRVPCFIYARNIVGGTLLGTQNAIYLNGASFGEVANLTIGPKPGGTLTVTGGSAGQSWAIRVDAGYLIVNGTCIANQVEAVFINTSNAKVEIDKVEGNSYGSGSVGVANVVSVNNPNINSELYVREIQLGSRGQWPIGGTAFILPTTSNAFTAPLSTSGTKTLVDPNATGLMPSAANVRLGTTYASGNFTGTMAVPAASSVAAGVAVDNTVGTAALTPASVWNYALSSASSVAGSVGEKLKKTAIPADIIALG